MRIHTSATLADVQAAAQRAGVFAVTLEERGSRSRERAFEVKLEGSSRRRPNGGPSGAGSGYAATWDQWGIFLGAIFAVDPGAKCWAYDGVQQFDSKTAYRFEDGTIPQDMHGDHRFRFEGRAGEQSCTKCSAVTRWL